MSNFSEDRNLWNGLGAIILVCAVIFSAAYALECYHPQKMAEIGYVELEGGRYVPANTDSQDPRVDQLAQQVGTVVDKIQRQLTALKEGKKDK